MPKVKNIIVKATGKVATAETNRRSWRTMLQVFLSLFFSGLVTIIPNWGTQEFKIGLFVLLASAIGGALGYFMNLEDPGSPGNGEAG